MAPPKSTEGMEASVEVEVFDWHRALTAVMHHTAGNKDVAMLGCVRVLVEPDLAYLMATDRFTMGLAVVKVLHEWTGNGSTVVFDLTGDDIAKLLAVFKPHKGGEEDRLRFDIREHTVRVTELRGMVQVKGDAHHQLLRQPPAEDYPDLRRLICQCISEATALREGAQLRGVLGEGAAQEVFTRADLLARFGHASSAYGHALVLERTQERRSAFVVSAGPSFRGVLMPQAPDSDEVQEHRQDHQDWLRLLPSPDDQPIRMPAMPAGAAVPDGEDTPAQGVPDEDRALLAEAAGLILNTQHGSGAMLQRKLRVGFAKAARLLEQLEGLRVIGPSRGGQPREVLYGAADAGRIVAEILQPSSTQDDRQHSLLDPDGGVEEGDNMPKGIPGNDTPAGQGPVSPEYVEAPDDGTVLPGDRLRCLVDGCTWTVETSLVDSDASLSDGIRHVQERHGFGAGEWRQAAHLIRAERPRGLVQVGGQGE